MEKHRVLEQLQQIYRAKWKGVPATDKQKRLLNRFEIVFDPKISKGDAFFLISLRLNGGTDAST